MTLLFIFLDGVGLGSDNALTNPFVRAEMPNLRELLDGKYLSASAAPFFGAKASLLGLDACLGVEGLPQSATGQAVLLTGINVPAEIAYHYGPKPDKATAAFLQGGGIFGVLTRSGKRAALINAYPSGYFQGIQSGRRLYSAIPLAVVNAGLALMNDADLLAGRAISADFTSVGWRDRLQLPGVEVFAPEEAGRRLALLAGGYDFAFFEYWLTDYAGHAQSMDDAAHLLAEFDAVLGGLLHAWDEKNLILITSDHGNLEDLSTRKHTMSKVPLLLIGDPKLRQHFYGISDLSGVFSAILQTIL